MKVHQPGRIAQAAEVLAMLGGRRKHPTGPTAYGYKKKKNARRGRASRLKKKEAIEGVSPLHPNLVRDRTTHFIGQRLSKTFATKNYCSG